MAEKLIGACVVAQSGGPTAVINSSIYGAIKTAIESENITGVYGALHGIVGVLNDELIDLRLEDPAELALLPNTPASALGSCRYKMKDPAINETDYKTVLEVFKRHNVRYFFYNGGNDSMDTCEKLSRYFEKSGYECRVMGIPKTIDNDLMNSDHCPGYGSAAKYIATSISELYTDTKVYDISTITVVEIMGRDVGWLTAASALARANDPECGPQLIYVPEIVFDLDKFLDDINRVFTYNKDILIAVSEGIADKDGKLISQNPVFKSNATDAFGHTQLGGLAATLAGFLKEKTDAKVRGIELSLLQRCASHCASQTDLDEAFLAGKVAVESALNGESGKMVAFKRAYKSGRYVCQTELVPLNQVANGVKKVPREWINAEGNDITNDFIDYALPLIQGEPQRRLVNAMPRYTKLRKIFVK